MSPVSILPGRVRFESKHLTGSPHVCNHIEEYIKECAKGVLDVTVNHRTGRILVEFDENQIDKQTLVPHIYGAIKECKWKAMNNCVFGERKGSKPAVTGTIKHAFMEVVVQAVLPGIFPKPFNILFPIAMKAIVGKN